MRGHPHAAALSALLQLSLLLQGLASAELQAAEVLLLLRESVTAAELAALVVLQAAWQALGWRTG